MFWIYWWNLQTSQRFSIEFFFFDNNCFFLSQSNLINLFFFFIVILTTIFFFKRKKNDIDNRLLNTKSKLNIRFYLGELFIDIWFRLKP